MPLSLDCAAQDLLREMPLLALADVGDSRAILEALS